MALWGEDWQENIINKYELIDAVEKIQEDKGGQIARGKGLQLQIVSDSQAFK